MSGPALDRVFRSAGGRIIAALAARYRNLTLAEDAFSEACIRALVDWPANGVPNDPPAWLYRTASRVVLDQLRQQRVREAYVSSEAGEEHATEPSSADDRWIIPDERLRLIFICCHPAVAQDVRAALTLSLVCGLTTTEIARAFLVTESTLAQRLVRAKRKIAEAGVPFELPPPELWAGRVEAVLSTLEIAYAKAHEDASGTGPHGGFAVEVLQLTSLLAHLLPHEIDAYALAALVRYTEARRPARVDAAGRMIPLSEQDPASWNHALIAEADALMAAARTLGAPTARLLQAQLQAVWCARRSLADSPPWQEVLSLYDSLLSIRDDEVVRINRLVALSAVMGPERALRELEQLPADKLADFVPYHAVRADLLARTGRIADARRAYQAVLSLDLGAAEAEWIRGKLAALG